MSLLSISYKYYWKGYLLGKDRMFDNIAMVVEFQTVVGLDETELY